MIIYAVKIRLFGTYKNEVLNKTECFLNKFIFKNLYKINKTKP